MRISIIAMLIIASITSFSQSSFLYKKNQFGELEVYQSQGGLPTGSPLYKIKKNLYGYLEVQNIQATSNPFTGRPDYSAYSTFKNYQLPTNQIFETLENLNKRAEYDFLTKQPVSNSPEYQKEMAKMQEFFTNKNNVATAYLKFHSSFATYPKVLRDGWYEVVDIYSAKSLSSYNIDADYSYEHGICKVENNRVVEYYKNIHFADLKQSFVFQKIQIDVSAPITSCKANLRAVNSDSYTTLYFMDNLLDENKQIPNPNFYTYSAFTGSSAGPSNAFVIQIARNKNITKEEIKNYSGGPYITYASSYSTQTNYCGTAPITIAIRKPENDYDTFTIGIINMVNDSFWVINNVKYYPNVCHNTTLN